MKLDIQKFAVSKSTTFSESNLDVVNNTSSLTITIYFSANNSSTWFSSETLYCTCNGVTQSANVKHPKGGSVTKSFTFNNIKHNADGTKTVSWSWNCNTSTSVLGNVSASGTKKLSDLHKPPQISSYSITETNQDLINANVDDEVFVANLSQKRIDITYTLYDNASFQRATAFNHTTPYSNTDSNDVVDNGDDTYTIPVEIDFTQNPLVLQASKETSILGVPFLVRVEDSLNGLRYFTNKYGNFTESPSTGEYRDFYNYIPYIPVSFTSTTKAKRVGQLSGQVALDIEGVYFNGAIGNVNQGVTYGETQDTEFLDNKNYYMLDNNNYILLQSGVDYQIGDSIEFYFTTVYDESGTYKPTIKYKYWKYGEDEPTTYENIISNENITVSNGVFSVSDYEIGSTSEYILTEDTTFQDGKTYYTLTGTTYSEVTVTVGDTIPSDTYYETNPMYFDPNYAYRVKIYAEDKFTNAESNELSITIGEATWTEYKDRVDFKKLTIKGKPTGYYVGDTIQLGSTTNNYYVANGYITSGVTKLFVTIFLPKKLIDITTITPTSVNVEARGISGYLNSRSGFNEYVGASDYTVTATQVEGNENAILLTIEKTSAFTNVSNNTLISLVGYFGFKLS